MKLDDFYKTIYQELSKKGFKLTRLGVKKDLLQHPFYPSMQSISDYFNHLGIANTIVKINLEQLKMAQSEANAILLLRDAKVDELVWLTEIRVESVSYANKITDSVDEFVKKWTGVALLFQIDEVRSENDYELHKEYFKKSNLLILSVLLGFILTLSEFLHYDSFSSSFLMLLPKVGGFTFALMLFSMDLGYKFSLTQKVCSIGSSDGCERIAHSKAATFFQDIKLADIGLSYFSTILIYQLTDDIKTLSWAALFCIPIVIFSLIYQTFILKAFCPLCLCVMAMLVLDVVIYFSLGDYDYSLIESFSFVGMVRLISIGIVLLCLLLFLKQHINGENSMENYKYQYYRLLRNPNQIGYMLQAIPESNVKSITNAILLGDMNSEMLITEVMNPYCYPCGESMKLISQMLEMYEKGLKFQLLFIQRKDNQESSKRVISHILSFSKEHNQKEIVDMLLYWFEYKEYEKLIEKYPISNSISTEELNDYFTIEYKLDIGYTPTTFIDGKKMKAELGLYNVQYYIEDVLPVE